MVRRELYYGVGGIECPLILYKGRGEGVPAVLLHGYSFRGETWARAGVLEALEDAGYDYAAPDMPYGRSTGCTKKTRDPKANTNAVHAIVKMFLGERPPVIVGASLGGRIALYYAARFPVKGLFLASPAVANDDTVWELARALRGTPALIIRGGRDFIPRRVLEELARRMEARYVEYPDAGHAMYLDQPRLFINDLLSFLDRVQGAEAGERG